MEGIVIPKWMDRSRFCSLRFVRLDTGFPLLLRGPLQQGVPTKGTSYRYLYREQLDLAGFVLLCQSTPRCAKVRRTRGGRSEVTDN